MKRLIILIILFFQTASVAQEETILAAIQVTHSCTNDVEDSNLSIDAERYLVFDQLEDSIDFVNVVLKYKSHSTGKIQNLKKRIIHQKLSVYTFDWCYSNSYDDKKGIAKIQLEIYEREDNHNYDKATVSISNEEGLNLFYSGQLMFYKTELAFYYNFEKDLNNNR
jgi:hypothetical protein